MALSTPVARELFHTRDIQCSGYHRADGLWDIEACMVDSKSYDMGFYDGRQLPAGAALHRMWLRLTLDDALHIHAVEVITDDAPFPACPEINRAYQQLQGLTIGPGFSGKVRNLFKGTAGCTHLTELLGPAATTAIQTIRSGRQKLSARQSQEVVDPSRNKDAVRLINSCHGWSQAGEAVAVLYPHLAGPRPGDAS